MDIEEYIRNNPHDTFFKETFTQKENAVSFLKNYLPEEIKELVDTENIKIEKDSFVSDELDENFSDILYRVDLDGEEGYIYTLFEHKSSQDYNTSLQLLEYLVKVWQSRQKQKAELSVVIPILVYHGQQEWEVSTKFSDILEVPDESLLKYTPNFEYILHDFTKYDDKEIIGTDELRARLRLMKHIRDQIDKLLDLFGEELILNQIKSVGFYILSARDEEIQQVVEKFKKSPIQGENIMSTADKLIKKGREKGKKEGKKQEQIEIAKKMLKKDKDIEEIVEITELPEYKVKKLKTENN